MIRGTTSQFRFKLPYSKENVKSAEVVFWQHGHNGINEDFPLPIVKKYNQYFSESGSIATSGPWNWINDNTLGVKLWQQETLTFSDRYKAYVQIRGTSIDGSVFASGQKPVVVYPIYADYPLEDEIIPPQNEDGFYVLDGEYIV